MEKINRAVPSWTTTFRQSVSEASSSQSLPLSEEVARCIGTGERYVYKRLKGSFFPKAFSKFLRKKPIIVFGVFFPRFIFGSSCYKRVSGPRDLWLSTPLAPPLPWRQSVHVEYPGDFWRPLGYPNGYLAFSRPRREPALYYVSSMVESPGFWKPLIFHWYQPLETWRFPAADPWWGSPAPGNL